jgi:hypothetical protein
MMKLPLTVLLWLWASNLQRRSASLIRFQPVAQPILPFALIRAASTSIP